ncbi:MAG: hydrolase [Gammaproteobacteria bacterium]
MIKQSTFKPACYLPNRHLQTILPSIIHPISPVCEKERVELADGDFIDLVWSRVRSDTTLLILHGLEGSIRSSYAKRILNYCNQHQISAVLMHFRGCSGEPNRLLRSYHSGVTDDLRLVIEHLKSQNVSRIALLGYSLGGNLVLKYMGESGADPSIHCAVAISVPLRLDICADTMNRGFAKFYQSNLLKRMVEKIKQKRGLLEQSSLSFPIPGSMRNFREFDDCFTAPIHGFDGAQHYYHSCSSRQFLAHIEKPVLIIQSFDDPFMSPEVLPSEDELSTAVTLELSSHGGHAGFYQSGALKPRSWLEPRVHRFLIEQQYI